MKTWADSIWHNLKKIIWDLSSSGDQIQQQVQKLPGRDTGHTDPNNH